MLYVDNMPYITLLQYGDVLSYHIADTWHIEATSVLQEVQDGVLYVPFQ